VTTPEGVFVQDESEARERAEAIVAEGGLAWVVPEYGGDMGRENVFWGWRVMFFSRERIAEAAGLAGAIEVIEALAEQQAMPDDFYVARLDELKRRVERPFRTATGRVLSDEEIQALADEAEQGYDIDKLEPVTPERRAELRRKASSGKGAEG
jgi:hypothetical protein